MGKTTKSKLEYIAGYKREKCKSLCISLNKERDADIIAKLEEVESMSGYIKRLIREDIGSFPEGAVILRKSEGKTYKLVDAFTGKPFNMREFLTEGRTTK